MEYKQGDIVADGTPMQERTVLAEGINDRGDPLQLVQLGEGARLAGSCCTWAKPTYAVLFESRSLGTRGGRHFPANPEGEAEARELFDKWNCEEKTTC